MIREKNMKALKECRPELYELINNTKQTGRYKIISSAHPTKYPNLLDTLTGKTFYNNADPVGGSKRLIIDKKIKVPNLAVFLGAGLFYNIINYAAVFGTANSTYIVVEKDPEIFALALSVIDLEQIIRSKNIFLFAGLEADKLYPQLNTIIISGGNKYFAKAINFIEEPEAFAQNKSYYLQAVRTTGEAAKQVLLFFGNDPLDSLIGIDHTFVNINEIITNPGIDSLKGIFKDKTGIVVATGPSLNKNIHLLKDLYGKAVICAADASVRVMKSHGIKPHIATSLERVEATSRLFEGLSEEDVKDVFLAACPVIHPLTYENFKGERIVVYRNFATFEWLNIPKGTLEIGASAANMAFKVLEYLGCNPIILIGQDLAFGEDDLTHAKGSTFGEKEEQYHTKRKILTVEGNYVPEIKTTDVWEMFRKHYIKDVANFQGCVVNATEGGAKIPGTQIMSLAEAVNKYIKDTPQENITDTIKHHLRYPNRNDMLEQYSKTLEKVTESIIYCESAVQRLYDGYLITNQYNDEITQNLVNNKPYDPKLGQSLMAKTLNINTIFDEKNFFEILMHYVQSYYIRTMVEVNGVKAGNDSPEITNAKIMALMNEMFAVMVELIKKMLNMLHVLKAVLEINLKKIKEENGEA
ncbi:MAG: motility associated factor glycosyltransferase family protein [Deferribacterales bacterium]